MPYAFLNNLTGELAAGVIAGELTFSVTYDKPAVAQEPQPGDEFVARVEDELVLVTAASSGTWTISQRGYDGTADVGHAAGTRIKYVVDKAELAKAVWEPVDGVPVRMSGENIVSGGKLGHPVYNDHVCIGYFTFGSGDAVFKLFDMETQTEVFALSVLTMLGETYTTIGMAYFHVKLTPDGKAVVMVTSTSTGTPGFQLVIDLATQSLESYRRTRAVVSLTNNRMSNPFDVCGRVFASQIGYNVYVDYAGSHQSVRESIPDVEGVSSSTRPLAVSSDGKAIAVGGLDNFTSPPKLVALDYDSGSGRFKVDPVSYTLTLPTWSAGTSFWDDIETIALNDDGTVCGFFVEDIDGGRLIFMWNRTTDNISRIALLAEPAFHMIFAGPNGEYLLSVHNASRAYAWDSPSGNSRTMPLDGIATYDNLARSVDGRRVVAWNDSGDAILLDTDDWSTTVLTLPADMASQHRRHSFWIPDKQAATTLPLVHRVVQPSKTVYSVAAPATDKIWVGGV